MLRNQDGKGGNKPCPRSRGPNSGRQTALCRTDRSSCLRRARREEGPARQRRSGGGCRRTARRQGTRVSRCPCRLRTGRAKQCRVVTGGGYKEAECQCPQKHAGFAPLAAQAHLFSPVRPGNPEPKPNAGSAARPVAARCQARRGARAESLELHRRMARDAQTSGGHLLSTVATC